VLVRRLANHTVDIGADEPRLSSFGRVPNELTLMVADCLDLADVNTLVRTSRALGRLLTTYMYRRAKDLNMIVGRPYFLRAVDTDNLTAVRHFIQVGASVDMCDTMDVEQTTSLHTCVCRGNIEMAQLLIRNGVNMEEVNKWGWTPLYHAVICSESSEALIALLLDAGADISATCTSDDTILLAATMFGTTSIIQLLLDRGAVPSTRNDGSTALHIAAEVGTEATVQLLLDAGVDIKAKDNFGQTALHYAVQAGTPFDRGAVVKVLLQCGANIDAIDNEGLTPLQALLYWNPSNYAARSILHQLTRSDCEFCDGRGACVSIRRFTEFDDPVVDQLLSAGTDIRACSNSSRSPLDWATSRLNAT
jgi:ankyrin repeat protein